METPERFQGRERELEDAIIAAEVTSNDFRVYVTLLKMADRGTTHFPARWQPKSLPALAERCHVSLAGVKRSLDHLERHGWLGRYRYQVGKGTGGRAHPTHYQLLMGIDCNCHPEKQAQPEPIGQVKEARPEPIAQINRLTENGELQVKGQFHVEEHAAGKKGEGTQKPWRNAQGDYTGGPVDWGWGADTEGAEWAPRSA